MNNLERPYSYRQLISHLHLKIKTKSKISNFFHSKQNQNLSFTQTKPSQVFPSRSTSSPVSFICICYF
ncbi:hypothetical protein Hanom_Chr01g00034511 [Helianthus anomalus]